MSKWHNVVRILHLGGGLRAINNPGDRVVIVPLYNAPAPLSFQIGEYGHLISAVRAYGFDVIGVDFFEGADEIEGLSDPDWRPLMPHLDGMSWPVFEVNQIWSNISHAASSENRIRLFEKSRHISTQIRICSWRLRDMASRYHAHLNAVCQSNYFKPGQRFDGRKSQHMFFSAHAMFEELASLRDHLCIFAAREVLEFKVAGLDSWARLVENKGFRRSQHPLKAFLVKQSPWLELFGDYRNLFVHNAPLADAERAGFVSHKSLQTQLGTMPGVYLPLPSDPKGLRARLRAGDAPKSFEQWIKIAQQPSTGPDALAYCGEILSQMVCIAYIISSYSPVRPRLTRITKDDIIGDIKWGTRITPPLAVRMDRAPG